MNKSIPYGKQHIDEQDIQAVVDVLKSDYLTQGPEIEKFEKAFAEYIGSAYAVAVANGTAALHLSALSLGVNANSKVLTTPITFSASANCVRYCGGEVEFVDIDPDNYLIDINAIQRKLESSPEGTYDGIIPVDFAGRAVNLEEIRQLAESHHLWILEDACHAPGGYFIDSNGEKQYCGNGNFADTAIFSFHPVKHIAAGEGGMITTNNKETYQKLLKLRTHGITKNVEEYTHPARLAVGNANDNADEYPGWYMEMQELGYNYRLTDIQAALGNSQLSQAESRLARRREIARRYTDAFKGKGFIRNQSGVAEGHAYHLYIIEVDNRVGLYNHLREHEIYSQIHYVPVHFMPYYQRRGWKKGDLPNAEHYYSGCLSLPMYPTLTNEEQDFVIESVNRFYE